MITKKRICLAGDGWGAMAAYNSLVINFKNIEVLTNDENLKKNIKSDHKIIQKFEESDCEIVICAGYKPIIKKQILETKKFINIHYSLLPKYRGLHSTVWAILNNEKELGLTIHLMNEFIDDGDVVFQYAIANDDTKTATWYMNHFNDWISTNLGQIIFDYLNNKIIPVKQDKSKASWVGKRTLDDCKIDFSKSCNEIRNLFRVLNPPYPYPYIVRKIDNSIYYTKNSMFMYSSIKHHLGRIVNIDNDGVYVSCNDGYVIIQTFIDKNNNLIDKSIFKIGEFFVV